MKNKDFENMLKNVKPVMPSEGFKKRVLESARRIPVTECKKINKFGVIMRRYAAAFAVLCLTLVATLTLLGFYGENYYEVYVDVNPSIEVTVNRFGVINGVNYINDDAKAVFKDVELKGKKPEDAITDITYALNNGGYLKNDSEVFISGYSDSGADVKKIVEALYYRAYDISAENGYGATVMTGEFTEEQRKEALDKNISPLKYSMISELLKLDDGYTVSELSDLSMKDLNNIYEALDNMLTSEVISAAKQEDLSPVRYKLLQTLDKLGIYSDDLSSKTTAELKELVIKESQKKTEDTEKSIEEEAKNYGCTTEKFRIIYSIRQKDPSYEIEDLAEKSMFELNALDYALEKFGLLVGLFG